MIIKSNTSIARQQKKIALFRKGLALISGITLVLILYFVSIKLYKYFNTTAQIDLTLVGDAETVVDNNMFALNTYKLSGGECQSQDHAYAGKYSLKLSSSGCQFGFGFEIENVKIGDVITAEVWVLSPENGVARLAISSSDQVQVYVENKHAEFSNQWTLVSLSAKVNANLKDNKIKIYCYNYNEKPVYFDNLSYSKNSSANVMLAANWTPPSIHLHIPDKDFKKLESIRDSAVKQGILFNSDDAWVDGYILPEAGKENKEPKLKVSLRLKGDWTDHLQGELWSFRVQTPALQAWNRLKVFSLQTPDKRFYLHEWFLHQFFLKEDVLTTRYDFVMMKLNNKDFGVYAYEEHFLKQIPEYNRKKEGVIVRFVETGFWESQLALKKTGATPPPWGIDGSPEIGPFEESKIKKDSVLSKQYQIAQNLLYEYQYHLKPAKDIFDLDLLGKYYAIIDITGGYHGTVWHNLRFYYNPVTSKLEPIGFDGFSPYGLQNIALEPFLGVNLCYPTSDKHWYEWLFTDIDFLEKYLYYLEQFSQESYLQKLLTALDLNLQQRLHLIRQKTPTYDFLPDYLFLRGKNILNALYPTSQSLSNKKVKNGLIAVCNRHVLPLKIVGTATYDQGTVYPLDTPQIVYTTPLQTIPNYSQQIAVPESAKFLVCQVPGLATLYYIAISPWPIPEAWSPAQALTPNLKNDHPAYWYFPKEKRVVFRKQAKISEPIIIPKDYVVVLEPGTKLDLVQGAFILSYSAVQSLGTAEQPIQVTSSDQSGKSFTVIKTTKKSQLSYTTFSNLTNFSYNGWVLPGSVNFYEADVDISNCTFTKNHCEDALNIVRSSFNYKYNTISNTFGDGFDSDFCTGTISNSYFYNMGNDAIDFSTSNVTINDCKIEKTGDKGISMGEQGNATITNVHIEGAVIGIASKDLSKVHVKDVHLKNCKLGFTAFQKKPEYGEGYLYVESYTAEGVELLYKINPGSFLQLVGKDIK